MTEPVHEPEPTPTPEDKVWLAAHPNVQGLLLVGKKLLVPFLLGTVTIYFNARVDREKLRADAGYGAVAPAMKELQEHIRALDNQVQILQQLVLAQGVKVQPSAPSSPIETNVALETFKKNLLDKVQKSQGHAELQLGLPDKLDDLPAAKR